MPIFQDWKYVHNLLGTFDLQNHAWNISQFGSRMRMAARRGGNNEVSYRDGTLWTAKDYEENELDLAMWVIGCEEDGDIPDDPSDQFWENVQALRRMFVTDQVLGRLHKFHPTQLDGLLDPLEVFANVEVRDAIDFTSQAGATRAAFIVRFVLPEVWFKGGLGGEAASTTRANDEEWTVTVDSDVFIKDPTILLTGVGAASNVTIHNDSLGAGHWVKYNGVLAAAETVSIEVGAYKAVFNPGALRVTGAIDWSGQPQMFWLKPGENDLRIETTGSVGVQVTALGKYW